MKPLCIHGHFYQPPRQDPWLDAILPEGSAAPAEHWNQRIHEESYAPLAWARRLDGDGRIIELMNCYEFMSFNFGPTLLSWLAAAAPALYARILEGDRKSLARLGHGNAIAQICHHVIMPLATDQEKKAEIAWAVADFEARFGRGPEGMWLSEAAVDTRTLELLAQAGIRFTILAPRQARQVAPLEGDDWRPVEESGLDIRQPYLVELPGGRSIAVFFYDGPLSQAVAFEGLLGSGDAFWARLSGLAGDSGLLALATDGETYGHHFKFGEMALAYVLSQARAGAGGVTLTNYAAHLAANPPRMRARIHEQSSWSCAHGVERWRADCGCATEHKPGWNQQWRGPLRSGLRAVKERLDAAYAALGHGLFRDAEAALLDYGRVESGLEEHAAFAERCFRPKLTQQQRDLAWRLLAMQKWALSSFASCAWFFDDLGRIEPLNALAFCLRAMDLAASAGVEENLEALLLSHLKQARSNDPALGGGEDIWNCEVLPRRESAARLCAQALLRMQAEDRLPAPGKGQAEARWPGVALRLSVERDSAQGLSGKAVLLLPGESGGEELAWSWEPADSPFYGRMVARRSGSDCIPVMDLSWGKLQALALCWVRGSEEREWAGHINEARILGPMFLPFREAQRMQTDEPRWLRLWSALCWLRAAEGENLGQDLLDFLSGHAKQHPEAELLRRRLGEKLAELLSGAAPRLEDASALLTRSWELGLAPETTTAQNVWWERLRHEPAARALGDALGFSHGLAGD